ncbi:pilus assembly protein TadE [Alcaligenes faecalis]|uniref:pilus assembly protein TadE n=1 Tax=Alcaligenes faecalis TaxID=511 RepID=UPI00214FCA49|nr:pilus assembly protein TadE [Alcaligenes faecalis]MCR4142877.1 pilus assembly protein TadE [Alcaligenes faecalis]
MSTRQKGIALVEACLLGVVLGLMVMAGRWLMQQQYRLQQMQQSTHLSLFMHDAHGKPVSAVSSSVQEAAPVYFSESPIATTQSLQWELLSLRSGFWAAQSRVSIPWPRWLAALPTKTPLQRQSRLWAAAGQANSTQQTRQRLENSTTAWGQAMASSRPAARETIRQAGPMDAAWGRTPADLDWLSRWQDYVPDHGSKEWS